MVCCHETRNFTTARGFDISSPRGYIKIWFIPPRGRGTVGNPERKRIPHKRCIKNILHNFGAPLQTTTLPNPASTDSAGLLCRVVRMVHFCRRIVCGCCGRHVVEYKDRDAPFYIPEIRDQSNPQVGIKHDKSKSEGE